MSEGATFLVFSFLVSFFFFLMCGYLQGRRLKAVNATFLNGHQEGSE